MDSRQTSNVINDGFTNSPSILPSDLFGIEFLQPNEIFGNYYSLWQSSKDDEAPISPNDIIQGALGDCWFLCAVACIAEFPDRVMRLFKNHLDCNVLLTHVFTIQLCVNGEWIGIDINDSFPCINGIPVFAKNQGNELWTMLLEKAYAKLHGSYTALISGWSGQALADLTGAPCDNYFFNNEDGMSKNADLFEKLHFADNNDFMMAAMTPMEESHKELGLAPGHMYAILTVKIVGDLKLLELRNPWKSFEWQGDWSDDSPLWTPEIKAAVGFHESCDDGLFWIAFDDFFSVFSSCCICKTLPNAFEFRESFKFELVEDFLATSFRFEFDVLSSNLLYVSLFNTFDRAVENSQHQDIGLLVYVDGELIKCHKTKCIADIQLELLVQEGSKLTVIPISVGSHFTGSKVNLVCYGAQLKLTEKVQLLPFDQVIDAAHQYGSVSKVKLGDSSLPGALLTFGDSARIFILCNPSPILNVNLTITLTGDNVMLLKPDKLLSAIAAPNQSIIIGGFSVAFVGDAYKYSIKWKCKYKTAK